MKNFSSYRKFSGLLPKYLVHILGEAGVRVTCLKPLLTPLSGVIIVGWYNLQCPNYMDLTNTYRVTLFYTLQVRESRFY